MPPSDSPRAQLLTVRFSIFQNPFPFYPPVSSLSALHVGNKSPFSRKPNHLDIIFGNFQASRLRHPSLQSRLKSRLLWILRTFTLHAPPLEHAFRRLTVSLEIREMQIARKSPPKSSFVRTCYVIFEGHGDWMILPILGDRRSSRQVSGVSRLNGKFTSLAALECYFSAF